VFAGFVDVALPAGPSVGRPLTIEATVRVAGAVVDMRPRYRLG
jgi:hypothetical protein